MKPSNGGILETIYLMRKNDADKFHPGRLVLTMAVNETISINEEFSVFVLESVRRHITGDWGDVSSEDAQCNNQALESEQRIFSAYRHGEHRIWIITEANREITTILFPNEY